MLPLGEKKNKAKFFVILRQCISTEMISQQSVIKFSKCACEKKCDSNAGREDGQVVQDTSLWAFDLSFIMEFFSV
jgi:hypothetical protein